MSNARFYSEWLGVEKNQFRILSLLAPTGEFRGNLSDMCRKLHISSRQTTHRNALRENIAELVAGGYITCNQSGRTYTLTALPQKNVIEIPTEWLDRIMNHEHSSESVSWQAVLKVFLWIIMNPQEPIVTREEIAEVIKFGVDTITSSLKVLENEYKAIVRKKVNEPLGNGEYMCIGLNITPSAWWG